MMRALSGAGCTDVRLYTLRTKTGTRTTSARKRSHCSIHLCYKQARPLLEPCLLGKILKYTKALLFCSLSDNLLMTHNKLKY